MQRLEMYHIHLSTPLREPRISMMRLSAPSSAEHALFSSIYAANNDMPTPSEHSETDDGSGGDDSNDIDLLRFLAQDSKSVREIVRKYDEDAAREVRHRVGQWIVESG